MQVALGLQYIQDRTAFHGTFHDTACAYGIADGVNISMGIGECFLKLRQNRVIGAHSKTVESVIEGEILDGSVRKLYSECVFFYFLKSIYELNADYVKYSRFLGIKDHTIVKYVFRNAMLPQITGLAMSLGTMIGGNLVAEMVFSYPGLGTTMLSAVTGQDYPLLSACTLIITIMVLLANLLVELLYAVIDPRVKASQQD